MVICLFLLLKNIRNISFISYNGIDFPVADSEFDMVISRYALHHFPDIQKSISEVSRVIKQGALQHDEKITPKQWKVDKNMSVIVV